eukprot:10355101-Alexandrium_andersonii.AAC.1
MAPCLPPVVAEERADGRMQLRRELYYELAPPGRFLEVRVAVDVDWGRPHRPPRRAEVGLVARGSTKGAGPLARAVGREPKPFGNLSPVPLRDNDRSFAAKGSTSDLMPA